MRMPRIESDSKRTGLVPPTVGREPRRTRTNHPTGERVSSASPYRAEAEGFDSSSSGLRVGTSGGTHIVWDLLLRIVGFPGRSAAHGAGWPVTVSLARVVVFCPASTHTALVSSSSHPPGENAQLASYLRAAWRHLASRHEVT